MKLSYLNYLFLVVLLLLSFQKSSIAQSKPSFGASLKLVKSDGKTVEGGILYEGERIEGIISFNEKEWDGKSRFYCYVFHYTEGENVLNPAFPLNTMTDNFFPVTNADGSIKKTITLFEGVVSPPYGRDNFILLMTEHPIPNFKQLLWETGNRSAGAGKQELMKLIKGSKLSEFYQPQFGDISIRSLQFESRPQEEKHGLTRSTLSAPPQLSVFVLNDSAEIFYTPKPQSDIVRDSFPIVEITDPSFDTVATKGVGTLAATTSKKILIRGVTVDQKRGIKKVTVNGQPVTSYRANVGYFDYLYELKDGINTAFVSVENNSGYTKTVRVRFRYNEPKQEVVSAGKDYLLVIGIDNYKGWPPLYNASKDAKDFENLMMQRYGFKKENVIELFNQNATNKNMYLTLESLVRGLNPTDRLLVYFSGHGYYDDVLEIGYWIPSDAHENASNEYLDNLRITRMFSKMKANNIFVIADACYSGQLLRDMHRENSNNKSRLVLCSGKLQPVSDGEPGTNSPFARQVLDYLKSTNASKVMASDLIQHVKKSFSSNTQKPVGGAIDEVGDENGDFVFEKQ